MFPACSDSWPRSSDPAFGANSMPSPAPSTVPVSSPITKLPPPLSLLSKRSYPSAISPPQPVLSSGSQVLFLRWLPRPHESFERHAQAAPEANHAAGLGPYVRAHPIGGVIDAIDR